MKKSMSDLEWNKIIPLCCIALFLLLIFPQLQAHWLAGKLIEPLASQNEPQDLFRQAANSATNYLIIYVFNIMINVIDILGISFILFKAMEYIADSILSESQKGVVKYAIVILNIICVFAPFFDIYRAGLTMLTDFGAAMKSLETYIN